MASGATGQGQEQNGGLTVEEATIREMTDAELIDATVFLPRLMRATGQPTGAALVAEMRLRIARGISLSGSPL